MALLTELVRGPRRVEAPPARNDGWDGSIRGFRIVLWNLAVAAAYFLLGLAVARFFAAFGLFPAPIWLPASIALAAAMLGGPRLAPGLFVGSFLANDILFSPPVLVTVAISLTNCLGPILAAWLIRQVAPPDRVFHSLRSLGAFVGFGLLLHGAIVATGGAAAIGLSEGLPAGAIWDIWTTWWLSDAGGALYLAPTILLWATAPPSQASRRELIEGAAVSLGTLLVAIALFTRGDLQRQLVGYVPYLLALPLAWVTLRWSLRSAYTLFTLIAIIATIGTVVGVGPFNVLGAEKPLTALGAMVVLCSINALLIAALVAERREAVARLRQTNQELEARVRQRTRELSAARERAEEATRTKSQFLAMMSHDLRTPLNAIIGFADLIRREGYGPLQDKRYPEAAELIGSSGRHLLELVDALLESARAEAGNLQLSMAALEVRPLAEQALAVVRPMGDARGVSVSLGEGPPGLSIHADRRSLRQVLLNLLSNAVKFTPEGGVVRLELERRGAEAVIRIRDDGIGMSAEELTLALRPFGRADNAMTRADVTGTGLGLPLARSLTEAQGGRFRIESASAAGTTVELLFPALDRAPAEPGG